MYGLNQSYLNANGFAINLKESDLIFVLSNMKKLDIILSGFNLSNPDPESRNISVVGSDRSSHSDECYLIFNILAPTPVVGRVGRQCLQISDIAIASTELARLSLLNL